jgi:hypothetical protein
VLWLVAAFLIGEWLVLVPRGGGFHPHQPGIQQAAAIAVDSYNKGLESNSFWHKRELKLQTTPNGIGLALCFSRRSASVANVLQRLHHKLIQIKADRHFVYW